MHVASSRESEKAFLEKGFELSGERREGINWGKIRGAAHAKALRHEGTWPKQHVRRGVWRQGGARG